MACSHCYVEFHVHDRRWAAACRPHPEGPSKTLPRRPLHIDADTMPTQTYKSSHVAPFAANLVARCLWLAVHMYPMAGFLLVPHGSQKMPRNELDEDSWAVGVEDCADLLWV